MGIKSAAGLLLGLTLLFWGLYDRYEPAGEVLLQPSSLESAGRVRGEPIVTENGFGLPAGAGINFPIPGASSFDQLRVQGLVRTEGVERGRYRWSCGRLLLIQYDGSGQWISGHHSVIAEDGDTAWEAQSDVFEVDRNAARIDLVIQNLGSAGTAWFDRLSVEPIRYRASFSYRRAVFALAWLVMGALCFRRFRLHAGRWQWFILLNAVAILTGTLMPGDLIQDAAYAAKTAWTWHVAPKPETPHHEKVSEKSERKPKSVDDALDQFSTWVGGAHGIGHFALFASLSLLVFCSRRPELFSPAIHPMIGLLLFSGITESLQYLTLDRTPGLFDWLNDVYGLLAGWGCFTVARWSFRAMKAIFSPESERV